MFRESSKSSTNDKNKQKKYECDTGGGEIGWNQLKAE